MTNTMAMSVFERFRRDRAPARRRLAGPLDRPAHPERGARRSAPIALAPGLGLGVLAAVLFTARERASRPSSAPTSPPACSPGASPSRSASPCSARSTRPGAPSGSGRSRRCARYGPSRRDRRAVAATRSACSAATSSFVTSRIVVPTTSRMPRSSSSDLARPSRSRARRSARRRAAAAGRVRERPGDRDPLALPAREGRRTRARARTSPTSASSSRARRSRSGARDAAPEHRDLHVLERRQRRDQVVELEDEADCRRAVARTRLRAAPTSSPSTGSPPQSGRSSAPIRFSSVLLPHPEGPVQRDELARLDCSETPSSARILPPSKSFGRAPGRSPRRSLFFFFFFIYI